MKLSAGLPIVFGMKAMLTPNDTTSIRSTVASANDIQFERIAGLLAPAVESVDAHITRQLEDLSQDAALGFAEVHHKIEYLRSEINEIKQALSGLFR